MSQVSTDRPIPGPRTLRLSLRLAGWRDTGWRWYPDGTLSCVMVHGPTQEEVVVCDGPSASEVFRSAYLNLIVPAQAQSWRMT